MLAGSLRVYLGHDERDAGVHAERRGVIDYDHTGRRGVRYEFAAAQLAPAEKNAISMSGEGVGGELFDRVRAVDPLDGLAGGAG